MAQKNAFSLKVPIVPEKKGEGAGDFTLDS